ncbi:MAG: hypothetical protein AB7I40_18375 [Nocardioides sp.]
MDDTAPLAGVVPPGPPPVLGPPVPAPVTQPLPVQPGPVLVHIGEIQVSADTVYTPSGVFPVAGTTWYAQDQWTMTQKIPTWAIVCAVVGFCVLTVFSLLFLLAKESVVTGAVAVTVTNGTQSHTTYLPVGHQLHAVDVHNRVNYARGLAAR